MCEKGWAGWTSQFIEMKYKRGLTLLGIPSWLISHRRRRPHRRGVFSRVDVPIRGGNGHRSRLFVVSFGSRILVGRLVSLIARIITRLPLKNDVKK
jgi:hypothetical protein